jgi:von Willebrand factor type A domain
MMLARSLVCYALFLGVISGQGLDVMLVLETSPGTEQTIGLIRPKDFKESDRAGVIGFVRSVQVLQPLTEDREQLATALQRAGTRVTIGLGGGPGGSMSSTADITGAIQQACREFEESDAAGRKPVVIVFFTSDDPALSARLEMLKRSLRAAKARLFAVVIQRVLPSALPGRPGVQSYPFPTITAQFLSQLATDSGGRIFRQTWDLKEILAEARRP